MLNQISPTTKGSVYEIVTEQIIRQLEQGVVPWRKLLVSAASAAQKAADFIRNLNGLSEEGAN